MLDSIPYYCYRGLTRQYLQRHFLWSMCQHWAQTTSCTLTAIKTRKECLHEMYKNIFIWDLQNISEAYSYGHVHHSTILYLTSFLLFFQWKFAFLHNKTEFYVNSHSTAPSKKKELGLCELIIFSVQENQLCNTNIKSVY